MAKHITKILVVDPDEAMIAMTRTVLRSAGFEVLSCTQPSKCLGLMLEKKPDLVLMDAATEAVDAKALVKLINATMHPSSPVLLYSSLPEHKLEQLSDQVGTVGYLQKTGNATSLLTALSNSVRSLGYGGGGFASSTGESLRSLRAVQGSSIPAASSASRGSSQVWPASGTHARLGRVLFVDNDVDSLMSACRIVELEGFSADFTLSATECLRRIGAGDPPDVVVAEFSMPALNGAEILERAMKVDRSWQSRFIIVTKEASLPLGSSGALRCPVLSKPVRSQQLITAVKQCMGVAARRLG